MSTISARVVKPVYTAACFPEMLHDSVPHLYRQMEGRVDELRLISDVPLCRGFGGPAVPGRMLTPMRKLAIAGLSCHSRPSSGSEPPSGVLPPLKQLRRTA
jgi:hypothetical protein